MDPAALSLLGWSAVAVIFLVSGLVHGVLGLGFPLLATSLLAIMFDVRSAILLTLVPTVAVDVVSILYGGRWSESIGRHWPLAVMIPVGAVVGTWLLIRVDPSPFRLVLAAMILLYLLQHHLGTSGLSWVQTHTGIAYLVFGFSAGLSAGTVNVMVPLLIIFALRVGMTPLAMVQVLNLCFLTGKTAQIGTFGYAGMLTPALLTSALPLTGISLAALLMGIGIRKRVKPGTYKSWLHTVLAVMVAILVTQYLLGLRT